MAARTAADSAGNGVTGVFRYTAPMEREPEYFLYDPGPEVEKNEPVPDPRPMRVRDGRGREAEFALDRDGFALVDFDCPAEPFADAAWVRESYYPAVAERVRRATGASEVHVFDFNFRSRTVEARDGANDIPVPWAHNDYTELSAPQRVRDLMPERAGEVLERRYMFVNLWRPVGGTVEESPLAVCAAPSVRPEDFVTLALRYRDREGQIYFARHNPDHDWVYFSRMEPGEALLLKCFDSARDGRARYTMHAAFEDPTSPPDAPPRVSLEARTIAIF